MNGKEMKYSPAFQRQLEYAAYDCAQRGATTIGVDHLLMGLYREDFPLIDEVLATFRVDSMVVLDRLLAAHPEAERPSRPETVQMGPEALQVVHLAEQEADRLGHGFVAPPHTFLGLLDYNKDRLERYFIREDIFRQREDQVIAQVRDLVKWLRFQESGGVVSDVEYLDPDTVVGLESVRLHAPDQRELKAFAVRLRMLKRFRSK